ncbi:MAG: hypothetical protein ACP5NN_01665 [Methanolinea sp.]
MRGNPGAVRRGETPPVRWMPGVDEQEQEGPPPAGEPGGGPEG